VETIYLTEITELGPEVPEFLETGLLILFKAGAPPELAEMSALHEPSSFREEPPKTGDLLTIGDRELRITAVGDKAWKNVRELGHVVLKFNGQDETELPGEIYVEETDGLSELFRPGARMEIKGASS
jgi:PTS system glucitol/sorbitol-specific IIA component